MIEINIRSFLGEFNGSKFVVYFFLLIFSLLLSIRLDKIITVNYAIVFIPLWLGEACVFLGFIIGFASFISHPPSRTDIVLRGDFFAMCFQTLEHILLTMFQLMVYLKLEHYYTGKEKAELNWLLVFSPLFVQSFMAMIIAIWCIRHEKPFEFEMFFSVNIIQFVFLAFKLDNGIHWSWALVLVPTWILFSLFLLCSIYSLTIALFLNRHFYAHQHTPPNRRPRLCASICHVVLSIPLLLHLLLLAGKLDALESTSSQSPSTQTSFLVIGLPLMASLLILLLLSFGSRSGNIWWFGMRQPFCNFVFELFPCLQYYANISCKFGDRRAQNDQQSMNGQQQRQERRSRHRQNHNQYPQSVGPNNSNVRIYGVEEPSSSWMVSTLEEQRIILDETEPELCEIQAHHQSRGNNNKQEKQKHNRNNKDKLIAYLTVRSSIESPD